MRAEATRTAILACLAVLVSATLAGAGESTHVEPSAGEAAHGSSVPAESAAGESWLASIKSLFGMGEPVPVEAAPHKPQERLSQPDGEHAVQVHDDRQADHGVGAHGDDHKAETQHRASASEQASAGKSHSEVADDKGHRQVDPEAHASAAEHAPAEQGWLSTLLGAVGLGGGGESIETHVDASDGTAREHGGGEDNAHRDKPSGKGDGHHSADAAHGAAGNDHHEASGSAHGEKSSAGHGADVGEHQRPATDGHAAEAAHPEEAHPESGSGGWLSSLLGLVGLGGGGGEKEHPATPGQDGHHDAANADAHGEKKPGADKHADEKHGGGDAHHDGGGHGDGHGGGEHAEGEEPPPPPLWPDQPAVEDERQPFVLVRKLRALQDQVAQGSRDAYEQQRAFMRDIGERMRELPPQVWDDTRNVRAAVYYVLTGGDPRVLTIVAGHKTPIHVPRRVIRGALAYGEGRITDALKLLGDVKARELDPILSGALAFIQGTLQVRRDTKKALDHFDEARLLAPGTLLEESALRQSILILAREGQLTRFDLLSSQYARRFGKSPFARTLRRQIFAGVAKQEFQGGDEWIPRVEVELNRLTPAERAAIYLGMAEEATKGGYLKLAEFAARQASELYRAGTRERLRADLYLGAVLVTTDQVESGLGLLAAITPEFLKPADRELYTAAVQVGGEVLRPPSVEPVENSGPLPASVTRAQEIMSAVDAMFSEGTQ